MFNSLLLKVAIFSLFLVSPTAFAALVASYTFSGNANDSSGNGNDGSVVGAFLTTDRFGNANSAYGFDGLDDRIVLPVLFGGDQDPLTIAAWVKLTPGATGTQSLFGEYNSAAGHTRNFFRFSTTNAMYFDQYAPSGGAAGVNVDLVGDGGWQHVAMVKDADIISWYLNGALFGTSLHSETYSGAVPELSAIGSRPIFGSWNYTNQTGQGLYSFQGLIDDVYLYDNALSATEVATLSTVPLPAAAWLFISGLGLFGLVRRRTTAANR